MTVIIYTGNKVKSNRGEEKKKGFNWIFLLVSMQYPWKYLAFSWHYRRKHPRILYLCNWIGNRWTSLRMQYFLAVLIHWEKSVIQPSKQVKEAQKQLFYRLNCNNLSFKQLCMLASANKIQKKSINYNINSSTSHLKLFKISFFIISIVFLTLSLLNPKG